MAGSLHDSSNDQGQTHADEIFDRDKGNQTEKSPNGDRTGNSGVTATRRQSPPAEPGAEAREFGGFQGNTERDGNSRD